MWESASFHRKGWSALAESQVSGLRAGQVEILPVERAFGIAAERVPVVNSRYRVVFDDPSFAVDAERTLLPIHHDPELLLFEPIEFRAGKGCLIGSPWKRCPVANLGVAEAPRLVTVRIDISRRPRASRYHAPYSSRSRSTLASTRSGSRSPPASEQLRVQLCGFLAATLVDMVVERLQFASPRMIAIIGVHVFAENCVRVPALDEHVVFLKPPVHEAPHLTVLDTAQDLR